MSATDRRKFVPPATRISPLSQWRHVATGKAYRVLVVVESERDGRPMVVYSPLDGPKDPDHPVPWVRDAEEFSDGRFVMISEARPGTSTEVRIDVDDGTVDTSTREPPGVDLKPKLRRSPRERLVEGIRNPYLSRYLAEGYNRIPEPPTSIPDHPISGIAAMLAMLSHRSVLAKIRQPMVDRYAWAIPNLAALEMIRSASPRGVVEIGAGTGYWAAMLRQLGVDVAAYDNRSSHFPDGCHGRWHRVIDGGPRDAARHPDRSLMLCWPPREDDDDGHISRMAIDAVSAYTGRTLIYVGEPRGQSCAGPKFFDEVVSSSWKMAACVEIPKWSGMNDRLDIYVR